MAPGKYVPGTPNSGYGVDSYDLDLRYRVATNRLEGTAVITATSSAELRRFTLDLSRLQVSKVKLRGARTTRFTQTANKLTVIPAAPLPADTQFELTVEYAGAPVSRPSPWGPPPSSCAASSCPWAAGGAATPSVLGER